MAEEYKDIAGFEGMYQISNMGNVRSLDRLDSKGRIVHGRILIHKKDGGGYHQVCLSKDSRCYYLKIHRLVCEAFLPNPENKPTVNHKDENKDNNCLDNLEWATYKENAHHGTRMARCYDHRDYKAIGKRIAATKRKNGEARKVEQFTLDGQLVRQWDAIVDAARAHDGTPTGVSYAAIHGNAYRGFLWRYKKEAV